MVWGAIDWGFKSKLVFLTKSTRTRGINSKDYTEQVLTVSIFLEIPDHILRDLDCCYLISRWFRRGGLDIYGRRC